MVGPGMDAEHPGRRSLALDLRRDRGAPGIARAAVTGLCEKIGLTGTRCQTLLLLVSEVVTNAVLHSSAASETPIRFSAEADQDRVRVDVCDGGSSFSRPSGRSEHGGWGLHLLEREARNWGVQQRDGTVVWFELALGGVPTEHPRLCGHGPIAGGSALAP